jgi:hypothetical protein
MSDLANLPAYGGPGWQPRGTSLRQELGTHWSPCGMDSEWRTLKAVLLHAPGRELEAVRENPEAHLLREAPDPDRCRVEHEELALAYREEGVEVHHVAPPSLPPPNQMFVADLMVMTPEGVILGRPASAVRAGEERWVARVLGELGIPVLRSVRGAGTFEGADLMWLGPEAALLARGLRTNARGSGPGEGHPGGVGGGRRGDRPPAGHDAPHGSASHRGRRPGHRLAGSLPGGGRTRPREKERPGGPFSRMRLFRKPGELRPELRGPGTPACPHAHGEPSVPGLLRRVGDPLPNRGGPGDREGCREHRLPLRGPGERDACRCLRSTAAWHVPSRRRPAPPSRRRFPGAVVIHSPDAFRPGARRRSWWARPSARGSSGFPRWPLPREVRWGRGAALDLRGPSHPFRGPDGGGAGGPLPQGRGDLRLPQGSVRSPPGLPLRMDPSPGHPAVPPGGNRPHLRRLRRNVRPPGRAPGEGVGRPGHPGGGRRQLSVRPPGSRHPEPLHPGQGRGAGGVGPGGLHPG